MSAELLKKLKFIQGSIAKKDLGTGLTFFRIQSGRIQGYNGKIALSAPIDMDIECSPKASTLVSAISNCNDTVQLGLTKAGKLSVKSGNFRSYVQCIDDVTPVVEPEGEFIDIDGAVVMKALTTLENFIGDDAARPWSNGILFSGSSAFATNNVIIAEHWLGSPFPVEVVVPRYAIKEMLRIKRPPTQMQISETSLTLYYEDGSWLRSNLIDAKWPDVSRFFQGESEQRVIPETFFEGLNSLDSFTDKFNRVTFESGMMRTHSKDFEEGASYELEWIKDKGTFMLPMLAKLEGVAEKIDLSQYPEPCTWSGEAVRGVIVGLHWIEGDL